MSTKSESGARFSEKGFSTTDVIVSAILLVVSLAFALVKLQARRQSKSLDVSKAEATPKKTVSDATKRDWKELRLANVSNVRVSNILVHPIKSCRGTSVQSARYTPEGLEFDRKLVIIDAKSHKTITARDSPRMVLIHPRVVMDEDDEERGELIVSFPEDSSCEAFSLPLVPSEERLKTWERLEDISLWSAKVDGYIVQSKHASADPHAPTHELSKYLGKDVYLTYKGPRPRPCGPTELFPALNATAVYQDGYPLLVASEESLKSVQAQIRGQVGGVQGVEDRWATEELEMRRFRPNIVLEGASVPWAEDVWQRIVVGENDAPISLVSKCTRCLLPNVHPQTGERDKAVPYKVLMKFRTGQDPAQLNKPCFGVNGVPHGSGVVHIGDPVSVLELLPE